MKLRGWLVWNVAFAVAVAVPLGAMFFGFFGDWHNVRSLCIGLAVALGGTILRIGSRATSPAVPIILAVVSLLAVWGTAGVIMFGKHGSANSIDWLIPLSLILFGQASRWFERPRD